MSLPDPASQPTDITRPSVPPLLPGTVIPQMVKCGKPNCHCREGRLHGPYYYRVFREGAEVRKAYVPLRDLEAVRAACEAQRAADWAQERSSPMNARMAAVLHAGRNTARQIARALATARTGDNLAVAKEIGKDAAKVTARSRHLNAQAAKARIEARKTRGAPPSRLSLRLRSYAEAVVLEVDGEANLLSSEAFRAALGHASTTCWGRQLYVDLRCVTQMDGSAWSALVDTAREMHERAGTGRLCLLLLPESTASRTFTLMRMHMVMEQAELPQRLGEKREG